MAARLLKFLASLKLAVFVIVSMATLIAIGTFVEARYQDAVAASKLVYHTPWMFAVMILFAINLTAVMVDRWPWKRRHLSFLLAHIGILVLLFGSLVTMQSGLDGNLRVAIGQGNRFVSGPTTDFTVWSSFDGERYTKLFEREVDFFRDRPQKNPLGVQTDRGELKVVEYRPYMFASRKVRLAQNDRAGSALQFQIQNARVNVTEWLVQNKIGELASHNFGPAQIHLGKAPASGNGGNEMYLEPVGDRFRYTIFNKERVPTKTGEVKEGQVLQTGWMGLEFRVLQFMPKGEFYFDFKPSEYRVDGMTTPAVRITFQGKDHWLQENDVVKLFTEKEVYVVTYGNKRIDIGFDLFLKKFEVGRYPGTQRAASYQSIVEVPDAGEHLISMNEPLKYKGLTIYQASFQDGPDGNPIASIFSVNYDPGRWLKYLGSLILSIGVVVLFYDRRKSAKSQLAPKHWEE